MTRKPDEEFRGKVRFEYAEENTIRASVSMSGQIADTVYAGGSFEYAKTDGYVNNVVLNRRQDNSERLSARGIVRWTPSSDLEAVVIADASIKSFNEMMRGVPVALGDNYNTFADEVENDEVDHVGVQLNVEYNLNATYTIKSITGYRKSTHDIENDTDSRITNQDVSIFDPLPPFTSTPTAVSGATTPFNLSQRFISQELQLLASHGKLDWMGGLYYFDQHSEEANERFLGAGVRFPFAIYINGLGIEDRDGWAVYGNASYRMLDDQLELSFGARYSEEDVNTEGFRVLALLGGPFATTTPRPADRTGEQNGDNFSIMASISYDFTDDLLGYATYSEGWKAGGVNRNPTSTAAVVPYEDESSENYEIGVKTSWLDNRATLNAALFWIDLTNQQLVNFVPPPPGAGGTPQTVVDNAASSRVYGVEFELNARVTDNFNFYAAFAYNDTKFKDFIRVFNPTDAFDMSGLDFEEVPEITTNLSGTYRLPVDMFGGSEVELYLNYRYVDKITQQDNFAGAVSSDQSRIPSYDRLDARVSLIHNSWRVTGYVDNVLDSYDVTDKSSDPFFGGAVAEYQRPLEPRQFGVVITRDF